VRKNWLKILNRLWKQESPAVADKPAGRESMPKIAPIRRAYNVVADNTGLVINCNFSRICYRFRDIQA